MPIAAGDGEVYKDEFHQEAGIPIPKEEETGLRSSIPALDVANLSPEDRKLSDTMTHPTYTNIPNKSIAQLWSERKPPEPEWPKQEEGEPIGQYMKRAMADPKVSEFFMGFAMGPGGGSVQGIRSARPTLQARVATSEELAAMQRIEPPNTEDMYARLSRQLDDLIEAETRAGLRPSVISSREFRGQFQRRSDFDQVPFDESIGSPAPNFNIHDYVRPRREAMPWTQKAGESFTYELYDATNAGRMTEVPYHVKAVLTDYISALKTEGGKAAIIRNEKGEFVSYVKFVPMEKAGQKGLWVDYMGTEKGMLAPGQQGTIGTKDLLKLAKEYAKDYPEFEFIEATRATGARHGPASRGEGSAVPYHLPLKRGKKPVTSELTGEP